MNSYTNHLLHILKDIRDQSTNFRLVPATRRFVPSPMPFASATPVDFEGLQRYKREWCEIDYDIKDLSMHELVFFDTTSRELEAMEKHPRSLEFELLIYRLYPEHCQPDGELQWEDFGGNAQPIPVADWLISEALKDAIESRLASMIRAQPIRATTTPVTQGTGPLCC